MKYCFLDLETTGLDEKKDSLLEISFLIFSESGVEIDRFDEVFIPDKSPLTPFITHITGIEKKEVGERGRVFVKEKSLIAEKIGDSVIVGHNIDFDIRFLIENGIPLENNPRIDTHELARIILINEQSYALEILSQKYKFTHHQAHRAMSDVEASRDLFLFLKKQIEALPSKFLEIIRPALEQKTDWFAKHFFLKSRGGDFSFEKPSLSYPKGNISKNIEALLPDLSFTHSLFLKQGDSFASQKCFFGLAKEFTDKRKKILIISPKLDFFESIKKFPTPEVLLDPEKLEAFGKKETLNDQECTFYLQCVFRHFLGLRGVHDFNLFAGQRALWNQVHITDEHHEVFQNIIKERDSEDILALSPTAFFRFQDLELFQKRVLLIDETEIFAEKLLFASAQESSFLDSLYSENDDISRVTHFFITRFCREVIEPRLQRGLSGFPEKILIKKNESFPLFAKALQEMGNIPHIKTFTDFLLNKNPLLTRWVRYFPETGNLIFGTWDSQQWKEKKEKLNRWEKVFFYRHTFDTEQSFLKTFVGVSNGSVYENEELIHSKSLIIPPKLVSFNSPDFHSFCAETIFSFAKKNVDEENFLAVNFSSLETLKKIHARSFDALLKENITLLGERVSGGNGKLLRHIHSPGAKVLFTQKLIHPDFQDIPFSHLIVQKFPFSPPHPLLEEIEQNMKLSGKSFWNSWTIPILTANLSRRISVFPKVKNIIWLDPKENSSWGKQVLKDIFSQF
jgi:DNA polymerase III epsilon subunit-like protein